MPPVPPWAQTSPLLRLPLNAATHNKSLLFTCHTYSDIIYLEQLLCTLNAAGKSRLPLPYSLECQVPRQIFNAKIWQNI